MKGMMRQKIAEEEEDACPYKSLHRTFKCEANRRPLQAHSYTLTQIHLKTSGSVDELPLLGNTPLTHSGILDFTTTTHGVVI
jgi:hypothetical protein